MNGSSSRGSASTPTASEATASEATDRDRLIGIRWGIAALGLLALAPLAPHLVTWLPRCQFKALLGLPCPSCGTTRSALALAKLDLPAALAVNPLATGAWGLLIAGGLVAGVLALSGRPLPVGSAFQAAFQAPGRKPLFWALFTLVLLNWVYLWLHGT